MLCCRPDAKYGLRSDADRGIDRSEQVRRSVSDVPAARCKADCGKPLPLISPIFSYFHMIGFVQSEILYFCCLSIKQYDSNETKVSSSITSRQAPRRITSEYVAKRPPSVHGQTTAPPLPYQPSIQQRPLGLARANAAVPPVEIPAYGRSVMSSNGTMITG